MTQQASIPPLQVQITFPSGMTTFQTVGDQYYATPLDIKKICAGANVSANVYISTRDAMTASFPVKPKECKDSPLSGQTISRVIVTLAEPTPDIPPDEALITYRNGNTASQRAGTQSYATPLDITQVCAGANVTVKWNVSVRFGDSQSFTIAAGDCQDFETTGETLSQVTVTSV